MLANAETCPHPLTRCTTERTHGKVNGKLTCRRCGTDVRPERQHELRISPRVLLTFGECVAIDANRPGMQRERGEFRYAEPGPTGMVAAILTESGWRFVLPGMLHRAPCPGQTKRTKKSGGPT